MAEAGTGEAGKPSLLPGGHPLPQHASRKPAAGPTRVDAEKLSPPFSTHIAGGLLQSPLHGWCTAVPKVVILAGGYGKRLRPLTLEKPKPLVEVAGRPILEWQILHFKSLGYRDFVLLVGYKWEKIVERLGSGRRLGVRIAYVVEDEPLGTGGAIKNAEHLLRGEEYFIVTNGDIITNLDARKLVERLEGEILAAMALVPLRSPYGIVEVDEKGLVRNFVEKPTLDYWINAGVYAFRPEVLDWLPERGDIERTGFPQLAEARRLAGLGFQDVYWKSIDTVKDLEEASHQLAEMEWARRLEELASPEAPSAAPGEATA